MTHRRAFITGLGLLTAVGSGAEKHLQAFREHRSFLGPVSVFTPPEEARFPVGEVKDLPDSPGVPRTHRIARLAAEQALAGGKVPDAIVLGCTTGGMALSEQLLREGVAEQDLYKYQGNSTVGTYLAAELGMSGPVFMISTACSSGVVALKMALELIRKGEATRVLTGGVDSLCRLTYYGFSLLQAVDPLGCRPLDKERLGMNVAEGAGMMLIEAAENAPENAIAEVRGVGLSCDAYHATAPHPEGIGAAAAMRAALHDGGLIPEDIEYINLHGTATVENDKSEGAAIRKVFPSPPPLSSTKGFTGHTLGAAGGVEAAFSVLALQHGALLPNARYQEFDEEVGLVPLTAFAQKPLKAALSNSLGFGGNNSSVCLAQPDLSFEPASQTQRVKLEILAMGMLSGAGGNAATLEKLASGESVAGTADQDVLAAKLDRRAVRRLKRISRMALALLEEVKEDHGDTPEIDSVYVGTAWGPLSETHDFDRDLLTSEERFASPTDFVNSVHNTPAAQVAMQLKATGANVTVTGGNASFEQAFYLASLVEMPGRSVFVMGLDEAHSVFTPLFDTSWRAGDTADGGGALLVRTSTTPRAPYLEPLLCEVRTDAGWNPARLAEAIDRAALQPAAWFVSIPRGERPIAEAQLEALQARLSNAAPLIRYREFVGEFATASALAMTATLALHKSGRLAEAFQLPGDANTILFLSLGTQVSATLLVLRNG